MCQGYGCGRYEIRRAFDRPCVAPTGSRAGMDGELLLADVPVPRLSSTVLQPRRRKLPNAADPPIAAGLDIRSLTILRREI